MITPFRLLLILVTAVLPAACIHSEGIDDETRHPAVARWKIQDLTQRTAEPECPAHGLPLQEGIVPLDYGLLVKDPQLNAAREAGFPCARERIAAGCVVRSPTHARVRYCPACRESESAWRREHSRQWIQPTWL